MDLDRSAATTPAPSEAQLPSSRLVSLVACDVCDEDSLLQLDEELDGSVRFRREYVSVGDVQACDFS